MKKYLHILAKVIFSLILLMPVLGATGIFPPATRDLYHTDEAFAFIEILETAAYISLHDGRWYTSSLSMPSGLAAR
jgi:hypothetical protein